MDTMTAFGIGQANRHKPHMVFDWNKAARLIVERGAKQASAGLANDWEYTGGDIFSDGEPDTASYTYLASTWATPELEIDGEYIDCFVMESEVPAEWGTDFSGVKWPQSALDILKGTP